MRNFKERDIDDEGNLFICFLLSSRFRGARADSATEKRLGQLPS